ncbi:hypothetical protein O0L34_g17264 [Tuta absoluta]|nr:hypothetical protein O0L34_g17264 [Tuta absoluta]
MLLPGCHISRTWFFLTVFVISILANPSPSPDSEDKTFNLKIGFDLTHGKDGAPALRIRDFEDEYHPRAEDKDKEKDKEEDKKSKEGALRQGDSVSSSGSASSEEVPVRKEVKKKESSSSSESAEKKTKSKVPPVRQGPEVGKDKSDEGSGVSEEDNLRSTRGIENYEPEEARHRRHKRSPEEIVRNRREAEKFIDYYFEKMKLKHKKVNRIPDEPRITSYKPY